MAAETATKQDSDSSQQSGAGGAPGPNRRQFLAGVGALAGTLTASNLLGSSAAKAWSRSRAFASRGRRLVSDWFPSRLARHRRERALQIRLRAAKIEYRRAAIRHRSNGDEERLPGYIGNFSKRLPHDEAGEVDPAAYQALLAALRAQDFAAIEALPGNGTLANPLGALFYAIDGPDPSAIAVRPPPSIASSEWAAQMAQLYWMALLRDVNFDQYGNAMTATAQADLASIPGYFSWGPHSNGTIQANDLFRAATHNGTKYPGTDVGPMVSQFLLRPFSYDAIPVDGKIQPSLAGTDFMTSWSDYLDVQNGVGGGFGSPVDRGVRRFPINARDLGFIAQSDTIMSVYFRAAKLLGFAAPVDPNNPYPAARQIGFATFGLGHLIELIGKCHKAERHAWYTKWYVNRYLRPEAGGARVHQMLANGKDYPLDPHLANSACVEEIFGYNADRGEGSYLLPQMNQGGSPSHPSFTAGHAISAGACVTVLKAWLDMSLEFDPSLTPRFPGAPDPFLKPKQTSPDGTQLDEYSGEVLTLEGELNKLCHNLSWGRDMSGVHWPADNYGGNAQGEELAIRILAEEAAGYPEAFEGFQLRKFDGTRILIVPKRVIVL